MADSIPSLREKVAELQQRIAELEAREPVDVERVVYVDRPSDPVTIEVPVYIENPEYEQTIRTLQEKLCQFTSQ